MERKHIIPASALLILLLNAKLALAADIVIPSDFKVIVKNEPGFCFCRPVAATIDNNGKVIEEIYSPSNRNTLAQMRFHSLSDKDLQAIFAKFQEANFFSLSSDHSSLVTDASTFRIAVTMNQKSHIVSVYAPGDRKDDPNVKSFLSVWKTIIEKVPSLVHDMEVK
jgi:hypothetical protein